MAHGTEALLALLQLSDSAFPSGAFAQSLGLEQLVRERFVVTADDLKAFVLSTLVQSTATGAAVACRRAVEATSCAELESILEADRALYRTTTAFELRAASVTTGRRLIEETRHHLETPVLHEYAAALAVESRLGMQPVAFGVVAIALGVEAEETITALIYGAANTLLQASLRLMRLSHRDVQSILHSLRPQIALLARGVEAEAPLRSFHPLQEIAAYRHERAPARLFAS